MPPDALVETEAAILADCQRVIDAFARELDIEPGGDARWLDAANRIYGLFQRSFFDTEVGQLIEFFDRDWPAEMAAIGMEGLQEFMVFPNNLDDILGRLEQARLPPCDDGFPDRLKESEEPLVINVCLAPLHRLAQVVRGEVNIPVSAAQRLLDDLVNEAEFMQPVSCQAHHFRGICCIVCAFPENG